MSDKIVVLVTCGTAAEADRIAEALVEGKLAACVNVVQAPLRSTYRWKGKVETASEYLLLIKTSRRLLPRVQEEVERLHSYELPEVIALSIAAGSAPYLRWLNEGLRAPAAAKRGKRRS